MRYICVSWPDAQKYDGVSNCVPVDGEFSPSVMVPEGRLLPGHLRESCFYELIEWPDMSKYDDEELEEEFYAHPYKEAAYFIPEDMVIE